MVPLLVIFHWESNRFMAPGTAPLIGGPLPTDQTKIKGYRKPSNAQVSVPVRPANEPARMADIELQKGRYPKALVQPFVAYARKGCMIRLVRTGDFRRRLVRKIQSPTGPP